MSPLDLISCNVATARGLLHVEAEHRAGEWAYAVTCQGRRVPMAALSASERAAVIGAADDARLALRPGPRVAGMRAAHEEVAS